MRVAVVGATGAVGTRILRILEQRSFPVTELIPIASHRSAGRTVAFGESETPVKALTRAVFEGVDLALFDVPDTVAREWAPVAAGKGALVVDNSAAWRMDEEVPLVVPEINPEAAVNRPKGIIASANCTTLAIVVPLAALNQRWPLRRLVLASYQAASGSGRPGTEELWEQSERASKEPDAVLSGAAGQVLEAGSTFSHPLAFNVIPQCGTIKSGGYTSEELKLCDESRKILGLASLPVTATCVRVPVVVGHSVVVHAEFEKPVTALEARDVLARAPGVELRDNPEAGVFPTPLQAAGRDPCYVGRMREDRFDPHALEMFCVTDNLRKGAALNTVQIAELIT